MQDVDIDDIPLFMTKIPDKVIDQIHLLWTILNLISFQENAALAGIQNLVFDDPPEVVAENFKVY